MTHRITTGSWQGAGEAALNGMANGALSGAITGAITGGIQGGLEFSANPLCFVAGTVVLTAAGLVAIENIRSGDSVWAENPETGEKAIKQVMQTFVNETDELVHVFINGEEIVTTPEHPFYVPQKGWTGAVHLHAGDILVLHSGEYVIVEKIQHELLETPIKVYNFEVADFHTYFVGESAMLVHNACTSNNPSQLWDINKYSKGSLKFRFQGKDMIAQFDGKYCWAKDLAGHGGSAFKVYQKVGKELRWIADADKYGNWIVGKAKSSIGVIIKI